MRLKADNIMSTAIAPVQGRLVFANLWFGARP
jgi:hypothetical protein